MFTYYFSLKSLVITQIALNAYLQSRRACEIDTFFFLRRWTPFSESFKIRSISVLFFLPLMKTIYHSSYRCDHDSELGQLNVWDQHRNKKTNLNRYILILSEIVRPRCQNLNTILTMSAHLNFFRRVEQVNSKLLIIWIGFFCSSNNFSTYNVRIYIVVKS